MVRLEVAGRGGCNKVVMCMLRGEVERRNRRYLLDRTRSTSVGIFASVCFLGVHTWEGL